MPCFRPTCDLKVTKLASKHRLYFPKCLKQRKNHCILLATVQSCKQNLRIDEGPEKDAPSRKIATGRLQRGGEAGSMSKVYVVPLSALRLFYS